MKLSNKQNEKKFEKQFIEVLELIKTSRVNALKSINVELINLYWKIGEYISKKVKRTEWGRGIVSELANYILTDYSEFKGYSATNLWRMKQFYETYHKDEKLAPLVQELSWTHNVLIFSKTKSKSEREFYLRLAINEYYSKRELERQINSGYYERNMISDTKLSPVVTVSKPDITDVFKDLYMLDFLNLPKIHSEKDLRLAIVKSFKDFVLEFGKDFAFVGEEYRLSVGNKDFFIDLLFYHRELCCLVAFELKINDFKPEYLGKLNFYLEALDRDVKKEHENPSVGIILCKSKDKEVVEYALSRNTSPALISEYKTKLIPKKMLKNKLHELFEQEEGRLKRKK
jgi:predicted nuclease of restriction endonuclease-like (RecB) superfamily